MDFRKFAEHNIVILDGGMGTMLEKHGIMPGELPELWNITHSSVIRGIHLDYLNAGANVINTNTFGANSLKYSDEELKAIIGAAVSNAKSAISLSTNFSGISTSLAVRTSL